MKIKYIYYWWDTYSRRDSQYPWQKSKYQTTFYARRQEVYEYTVIIKLLRSVWGQVNLTYSYSNG